MSNLKEVFEKLHKEVADQLLERVRSGEATAAELGQAIKFLQNNGVDLASTGNNYMKDLTEALTDKLPFSNPEDPTVYN